MQTAKTLPLDDTGQGLARSSTAGRSVRVIIEHLACAAIVLAALFLSPSVERAHSLNLPPRLQDKVQARRPVRISVDLDDVENPSQPSSDVSDSKPAHPDLPKVLLRCVARCQTIRPANVVEEINDQRDIDPLDPGNEAYLKVSAGHRQINQCITAHPGDLS